MIGRFQPFHLGHLKAVEYVLSQSEELVIGLGSSQYKRTPRNPLSTDERYEMIVRVMRSVEIDLSKVFLVPIPDTESREESWGSIVLDRIPRVDVAYTNDRETRIDLEAVGMEVFPIPLYRRDILSATNIRRLAASGNSLWRQFVPDPVASFLDEIDFEGIMRDITEGGKS